MTKVLELLGLISKKDLYQYIKEIKDENRKEHLGAKYPVENWDVERMKKNCYCQGYEDGTDNMFNAACAHFNIKRK